MTMRNVVCQFLQAGASNARASARKIGINNFTIQTDGFKNLPTTIALQCGNADFRHHFHHAFFNRFDEVINRFISADGL